MGKNKAVYAGTKYYMGNHMVLCYGPVDAITRITGDDKELWSGTHTGGSLYINKPLAWGGESREGGVQGSIDVDMGRSDQQPNAYLQSVLGTNIPAYRDVVSIIWKRLYYGMNPYLKPWAVTLRRTQTLGTGGAQWYSAKADINGDLNAAHIIRECLTDPTWGLGYSNANLDLSSFSSAADQLYSEGFGLSFLLEAETTMEDFIQEVLGHVSGRLFASPTTGLFTLRLIRDNYDINTIPVFNESNVVELKEFERKSWSETINNINVIFTDRTSQKSQTVTVHDIANIQRQGAVVSTTTNYRGITNGTLALRVATRDLSILSKSLSKLNIVVNTDAFDIEAGDVFKFSWAAYGLAGIAYRVMDIDYGDALDGTISITALEDAFSLPLSSYVSQQPSGWVEPVYPPLNATRVKVVEAPYIWTMNNISDADLATLDPDFGVPQILVGEPGAGHYSYLMYTKVGSAAYSQSNVGSFMATATISLALKKEFVSTVYYSEDKGVTTDDYLEGTYAYIGNEMVQVLTINRVTKVMTVSRGVFDTVPLEHNSGTVIFFAQGEETPALEEYVTGEAVNIKALTVTGSGTLAEGSATGYTVVNALRHQRPYSAGNFKIDGMIYPLGVQLAGNNILTWAHRDRTLQTADVIAQNIGNIGPEAGTTYNLYIYRWDGVQVRLETGLTGTSYTYPLAQELIDIGSSVASNKITFTLQTVRNGVTSRVNNTIVTHRPNSVSSISETNNTTTLAFLDNRVQINVINVGPTPKAIITADFTTDRIHADAKPTSSNGEVIGVIHVPISASIIGTTPIADSPIAG